MTAQSGHGVHKQLCFEVYLRQIVLRVQRVRYFCVELDVSVCENLDSKIALALFRILHASLLDTARRTSAVHARIMIRQMGCRLLCVYSDNRQSTDVIKGNWYWSPEKMACKIVGMGGVCKIINDMGYVCYIELPIKISST